MVVPDRRGTTLVPVIERLVERGSDAITDGHDGYRGLPRAGYGWTPRPASEGRPWARRREPGDARGGRSTEMTPRESEVLMRTRTPHSWRELIERLCECHIGYVTYGLGSDSAAMLDPTRHADYCPARLAERRRRAQGARDWL